MAVLSKYLLNAECMKIKEANSGLDDQATTTERQQIRGEEQFLGSKFKPFTCLKLKYYGIFRQP